MAELAAAGLLTGSALFVMFNEGIANWQALWFGGLLVLLALTALRDRARARLSTSNATASAERRVL